MAAKLKALGFPPGLESWVDDPKEIHSVTIAPVYDVPFVCGEHPVGQLHFAGDALGSDCMIEGGLEGESGFGKLYRGVGARNSDWYGWRASVHAPFDGVVKFLRINRVENSPGKMGRPPASMIEFERADGVNVVYAHIASPRVKVGDHVKAGQNVAVVGNNGMARNRHIHIGAYKGSEPLEIVWDLRAMGSVPAFSAN